MASNRKIARSLGAVAVMAMALAACSSQGGAQDTAGPASADGPPLRFAMVTHAPAGDTFFDIIRKGADAAAAESNVEYTYSNDGDPTRQAVLIENAVNSGVQGLLVSVPAPAALTPAIKKAVDKGIPVVGFNAGLDTYKDWGALMYFGQDESVAGQSAGARLKEEGAAKVLCVIQAQGQAQLEARCNGVEQGFGGTVERINVTGTDLTAVRSTLESKLRQDPSISHVLTLGAPFALTAVQAKQSSGSQAEIVTFDTNPELVGAIESGDVKWAIDQQPYLQGFLAVQAAALYLRNGNVIGAGLPVLTGQAFIDINNVDTIIPYAKSGKR
jgi:simple sugar transport system substrate-binding protein